jgi:hypothetical protein
MHRWKDPATSVGPRGKRIAWATPLGMTSANRGLGNHLFHPLVVEVLLIPWHVGEKLLQALLPCTEDGLGYRVAILRGQFRKPPDQVSIGLGRSSGIMP